MFETGEIIDVKRITQYGFQLEDTSYVYATEQVRNFSEGKVPGKVQILAVQEKNGKFTITKVKILESKPESKPQTSLKNDEFRVNVDAGNAEQRAIELLSNCPELTFDKKLEILKKHDLQDVLVESFRKTKELVAK
jgi:hypothetical protein